MIKLLHIDDDQIEFEILYLNLTNLAKDMKISWADSGKKALDLLRNEEFDCVLCDFQMPLMNGFEILKTAKEEGIRIPFIFLTGQGNQEIAVEAFRAGADDYYTKEEGFAHYDRLVSRIRKIVEKEKEFKSAQVIFQNALNAIPDLICVYDKESNIVMNNWNSRLPGWQQGMNKSDAHKLLWGDDCHCESCVIEEVLKNGQPGSVIKSVSGFDSGIVRVSVYPVFNNKGEIQYVTEHIRNISTLNNDSGQPIECRQSMALSEELLVQGSWFWNIADNVLFMSSEMRRIFGFSSREKFTGLYDVLRARVHTKDLEFCMRSSKMILKEAFEFRIVTDGVTKWIHMTPFKVVKLSENGEPRELFGAVQDITERKEFENQLARSNSCLSVANEELESFAFTVSHDLRSPLRHIKGYLDIIKQDYSSVMDDKGQGFLEKISRSANNMENLIEDILLLSRASRMELNKEVCDVSVMASQILDDFASAEPDRKAEFAVADDQKVYADKTVLGIVLANLLGNAWKFSKGKEITRISLDSKDSETGRVFLIKDNGSGFNQANADELFTAFKRFHSQRQFPGTGIGLATVKRMLAKHGGSICAEGEKGEGASFYFTMGPEH